MISILTKVITMAINEGRSNGLKASTLASKIDIDILDLVIEFCKKHDSFHVFNDYIDIVDLEDGHLGYFHRMLATVSINSSLVNNITKRVCIGIGEDVLATLIETMLHEHRHAYQYKHHLPMTKVPYTSYKDDFQKYWEHPMEVDAREIASAYLDDAIGYVIGGLRKKYLSHTLKQKESTM